MSAVTHVAPSLELSLQFYSYWHSGGGRGAGAAADASVERDAHGLPFMGGRALKGLFRDAVNRWVKWGHYKHYSAGAVTALTAESHLVDFLFGKRLNTENQDRRESADGVLRFADATLADDLHAWLCQQGASDPRYIRELYSNVYSTAIDPQTGTAKKHTHRGLEVAAPLQLFTRITLVDLDEKREKQAAALEWPLLLREVAPLIRAVGASRNRGFGRLDISAIDTVVNESAGR